MKISYLIPVIVIAFLLPLSSHANTFCVSDATGLQSALTTAASNGQDDTIQIVQGNYVGSVIYASTEAYDLTVEGGYTESCASRVVDPANTVLDANNSGVVLALSSPDVSTDFVVDGLTIKNGVTSGNGGGIYVNSLGDIIIANNTIMGNTANTDGGGIWVSMDAGEITVTSNIIAGNIAGDDGGGIYTDSDNSVSIDNNTITGNSSYNAGGGAYIKTNSTITLTNNHIMGNTTHFIGSGVYCAGNSISITMSNNIITGNSGSLTSGGIYANSSGSITFTNNSIRGNSASNDGGVHAESSNSIIFTNNTITGNSGNTGGGVYANSISITFINNTVTENISVDRGGGIYLHLNQNDAEADIINNIIWNNTATNSGNDIYLKNDGNGDYLPSTVNLYNNDFDHSSDGIYIQLPFTIDPTNLDNQDPLFADAPNGNYHLISESPCIDTGRLEGAPTEDIDGQSRPQGDGIDIGADEYYADIDSDGISDSEDNCPSEPNGPFLGACVKTSGNIFLGTGVSCVSNDDCAENETCDMAQGDCNANSVGDACECYADINNDNKVNLSDLVIMKMQYNRIDCASTGNGCNGTLSPLGRWCDQGNGTVKDMTTGLVWLKDASCMGQMDWYNAVQQSIANLRNGDCSGTLTDGSVWGDWRLPTKSELEGITIGEEFIRSSQMYLYTGVQSSYPYWTTSTYSDSPDIAWYVSMSGGEVNWESKTNINLNVLPVRGPE